VSRPPQLRILLIERDHLEQVGMRSALSASGYRCIGVETVEAALALSERFDLLLLGPGFAEAEADQAATRLRAAFPPPTSMVALTALPDLVIGREVAGASPRPRPELPPVLEALTRYRRFAPARPPGSGADLARLVGDWAEFEGQEEE